MTLRPIPSAIATLAGLAAWFAGIAANSLALALIGAAVMIGAAAAITISITVEKEQDDA